ncbi:MAG TPA: hypothetical protein VGS20_16450 [Candidatus Acidoferrales bacterium]|nr:hypothetical protein [Candidatus Acidoferrales bacterium]
MSDAIDLFTAEYLQETQKSIEKTKVCVFLCGPGLTSRGPGGSPMRGAGLRAFVRRKLNKEMPGCTVRLGEHRALIRAFRRVVRRSANLADHELGLAKLKSTDLVVIFPSSPGSFAELGMFSMAEKIARKMVVLVDRSHRKNRGFLIEGPVKAARLRNATIEYVDYRRRQKIWELVREEVLAVKERKRTRRI